MEQYNELESNPNLIGGKLLLTNYPLSHDLKGQLELVTLNYLSGEGGEQRGMGEEGASPGPHHHRAEAGVSQNQEPAGAAEGGQGEGQAPRQGQGQVQEHWEEVSQGRCN